MPKLVLYRGWPERGCYVASPYVTKLELTLRLSNVPYVVETGSPRHSPRRKVPYVDIGPLVDPDTPRSCLVSDSSLIVKRLTDLGQLAPLEESLSPEQRGTALAIQALLEDRLYFYQVWFLGTLVAPNVY